MNQSNPIKRTTVSLGLALFLAVGAMFIHSFNSNSEKHNAEAKVYPPKIELLQK